MITPALVQADVIDICNAASRIPSEMVMDANVLYWNFYRNFFIELCWRKATILLSTHVLS